MQMILPLHELGEKTYLRHQILFARVLYCVFIVTEVSHHVSVTISQRQSTPMEISCTSTVRYTSQNHTGLVYIVLGNLVSS